MVLVFLRNEGGVVRKIARWSLIEELDPPPQRAEKIWQQTRSLRRQSNVIGFALSTQQFVATLTILVLIAMGSMLNTISSGSFSWSDFLNRFESFQRYDTVSALLQNMLCYFSYMFVPFILLVFCMKKDPLTVLPFRRIRKKKWLPAAVVISLAIAFVSEFILLYIQIFLGFVHLQLNSPDMTPPSQPGAIVLYVLFFCVLAPFCEESIFRGVILQSLRPLGNGFAILFSALLFAMMHGNIGQFPLAFLVGLALGYFVLLFDSLWVTILMHAAVNSMSTWINYMDVYAGSTVSNLLYFGLGIVLLAIAISTVVLLRKRKVLQNQLAHVTKPEIPLSFLFKRAFLTPGMIVFTVLFILLCIAGLRIM